jgi:prephenate dehydrogenase
LQRFGTVAIIGVGLIGGSVGLAVRARRLAERVVGVGRDLEKLAEARRLGAIDEATTDLGRGAADAEVVVVCTPVTRIAEDVKTAAALATDGLLVTDAGSTKQKIVEVLEHDSRARGVFVGAHPIAGSERQGAAHGRGDLFEGRACVLTPTPLTPLQQLARARAFWSALGSIVIEMSPSEHDLALAVTSHLPHAVASALAGVVPINLLALAAGAYRDGTRVAAADSALWAGILLENRTPLLEALGRFEDRLAALKHILIAGDAKALEEWWDLARAGRIQYESHEALKDSP